MKKSLLALAALAALSLVFVSCGGGDDPAGSTNVTHVDTPSEVVVFDPAAVDSVSVGEIIDVDGTKYWKVTVDGYDTSLKISPVDLKGMTTFKCTMYGEAAASNLNLTVKLADKDNADISSIAMYGLVTEASEKSAGVAEKQSWNTVSETMLCEVIQPMIQDASNGYAATSGNVAYIGKIMATK